MKSDIWDRLVDDLGSPHFSVTTLGCIQSLNIGVKFYYLFILGNGTRVCMLPLQLFSTRTFSKRRPQLGL